MRERSWRTFFSILRARRGSRSQILHSDAAVEGRVVLVATPDEHKHVTNLNFAEGSSHDPSEIGITLPIPVTSQPTYVAQQLISGL